MSDDLIKRLIILCSDTETELLALEAVDRIKHLEAALQEIASLGFWDGDSAMGIARKALEGKKDE